MSSEGLNLIYHLMYSSAAPQFMSTFIRIDNGCTHPYAVAISYNASHRILSGKTVCSIIEKFWDFGN